MATTYPSSANDFDMFPGHRQKEDIKSLKTTLNNQAKRIKKRFVKLKCNFGKGLRE